MNKLMDSNGNIKSDPFVSGNVFNKLFVNVSHDITENIPRSNKSPVNSMGDRVGKSFSLPLQFPLKYLI